MSSGEEDLNPPRMKHWPPTFRLGGRQLPEEMHFNCGPYIIGGCNDSDTACMVTSAMTVANQHLFRVNVDV